MEQGLKTLSPDCLIEGKSSPLATDVQDKYEKTMEECDKLLLERSASEQLARQMSRGLRIRKSAEHRVIRSPSARKIGAIRRRSRESPRANLSDSVIKESSITRFKCQFNSFYLKKQNANTRMLPVLRAV